MTKLLRRLIAAFSIAMTSFVIAAGSAPSEASTRALVAHASSSSGTILYIGTNASDQQGVYEMNGDGSNQHVCQASPSGSEYSLSPDGTLIVFDTSSGISVMNSDCSNTRQVIAITQEDGESPHISPDDSQIVYAAPNGPFSSAIFTVGIDGGSSHELTNTSLDDEQPSWLSNGEIVFTRAGASGGPFIYTMSANGTNLNRIASMAQFPSPSPNGREVAYTSFNPNDDSQSHTLYIVSVNGGSPTQVTASDVSAVEPTWSPDGSQLAFSGAVSNAPQIGVVTLGSGTISYLTSAPDSGVVPSWGGTPGPIQAACNAGYNLVARDGGIFAFGNAAFYGSTGAIHLNQPIVGMASTPDGGGYWLVASDGGIFAFGNAAFYGSTGAIHLNQPIVGMASTPDGGGYWLVASDGGIFAFGNAAFYGSTGAIHLNQPIVGMASTPDGGGYWLVASDGGIFAFGNAAFYGSTGAIHLNQPIVGMASTPDGGGYWLVASDGGIFAFGNAAFYGSTGAIHLNQPIVGMASTPDGGGYWLVASDGGIFAFGNAQFCGSTGNIHLNRPITGMAPTR